MRSCCDGARCAVEDKRALCGCGPSLCCAVARAALCGDARASAAIVAQTAGRPVPPSSHRRERAPLFGPCRTPNLQSRRLICVKRVLARRRRRKHAHAHEELDGEAECARPPIMHTPHLLVTSSLQLQ